MVDVRHRAAMVWEHLMIYLDNNATTPPDPLVTESMLPFLSAQFWNPSSGYTAARPVRKALDRARDQAAALLGCEPAEIIFTAGGTEADNAAIFSATQLYPDRRHLITCASEHDAVLNYCAWLERSAGYEITRLPTDARGIIELNDLRAAIRPGQTALISLMWANNETGVIAPVIGASAIAEESGILFHTDAVQAGAKIPLNLRDGHIHYLALSAHKFHAPKGVGLLYVNRRVAYQPWMLGGGQENQRRAGTENVAGIVALGTAAALGQAHLTAHAGDDPVRRLRDYFEKSLASRIPGVHIHGADAPRTPNTSNLHIDGVEAAALMVLLDQRGVYVSAGSACHAGSHSMSHVLAAMGLTPEQGRQTIRVSLSRYTTQAEIDEALEHFTAAATRVKEVTG